MTPSAIPKTPPPDIPASPSPTDPAAAALAAATARFAHRNPRSLALHERSLASLPGGNTRAQLHTTPFPVLMRSGRGHELTSEDGHAYVDMVGELTAGVLGHSHPAVRRAAVRVLDEVGLSLGATVAQEHVFAEAVCGRFGLERVRFCNSGTEANLYALAAARAVTGRRRVVVFEGGYHGGVLSFGEGGPGAGVVDREDWVVVRYNDVEGVRRAVAEEGVAAVLVEGMQGSAGAIPGTDEFLKTIQSTAREHEVVFILDEVMTSRLAPGGLAELYQLEPDMKTMGKWLGGGLAFGAFGGKADIMSVFDPRPENLHRGHLAHHGTFNNNTLTMHTGHAALTEGYTPEICTALNAQGDELRKKLTALTKGTKMCFTGMGAVLGSHFTEQGLQTLERHVQEDATLKALFCFEMMEEGFWLTRRGVYALILGTPQEDLDRFVDCVASFLDRHKDITRVEAR